MTQWEELDQNIKAPENVKEDEYRERLKTVYTSDGKLHCFGLKGLDPTNENWRETMLMGSYISTFDVVDKAWLPIKAIAPIDKDATHKEHLFAVDDQMFLFVYSKCGGYYKLFQWMNDNWSTEIKLEDVCSKSTLCTGIPQQSNLNYRFYPTIDGFYVTWEADHAYVVRLAVELEKENSSRVKSAKWACVAKWKMEESFYTGGHVTIFAHSSDHKKIFLWGGQEKCGFWWEPTKVHTAKLEPGKVVDVKPADIAKVDKTPPYAYSGPQKTIQWQDMLLMMGGSSQVGLGQIKDNLEVWAYDLNHGNFRKLKVDMPSHVTLHRVSLGVDLSKGDVYVCDKLKGIYRINVKNLL